MKGIGALEIFDCIPEIDFHVGYRYFLCNMENYKQALLSILKSVKSKLPLFNNMLETQEYEGLRTIVQTLRRMASNVGAIIISDRSYQLEIYLLNGDNSELDVELNEYIACLVLFSEHLEFLLKNLEVRSTRMIEETPVSFGKYDLTKTKESIKLTTNLLDRNII